MGMSRWRCKRGGVRCACSFLGSVGVSEGGDGSAFLWARSYTALHRLIIWLGTSFPFVGGWRLLSCGRRGGFGTRPKVHFFSCFEQVTKNDFQISGN
jgi:hypothetical protein